MKAMKTQHNWCLFEETVKGKKDNISTISILIISEKKEGRSSMAAKANITQRDTANDFF